MPTDTNHPNAFIKVVERESKPEGLPANSAVFHRQYPSLLLGKWSSKDIWPYDPEDDLEAMKLFEQGLSALFPERDGEFPDPTRAVKLFEQAIRCRPDGKFERAWLNMSVGFLSMGKEHWNSAKLILEMLRTKVEQTGEWQMTPAARSLIHLNLGQTNWLYASQLQSEQRRPHLEIANHEYSEADRLNDHSDTPRLLSWLVVQVELGLQEDQMVTICRIRNYVKEFGQPALQIIAEYEAKYPQLTGLNLGH